MSFDLDDFRKRERKRTRGEGEGPKCKLIWERGIDVEGEGGIRPGGGREGEGQCGTNVTGYSKTRHLSIKIKI